MRDISAWYRDEWRKKVERIGNLNYPDEARRQQIYGSLRMLVTINRDGTVQELRVIESSGQPVLDDAALRIVRLAAPFAPSPANWRRSTIRSKSSAPGASNAATGCRAAETHAGPTVAAVAGMRCNA